MNSDSQTKAYSAALLVAVIGGFSNMLWAANPEYFWQTLALRFTIGTIITAPWIIQAWKLPKYLKIANLLQALSITCSSLAITQLTVTLATIILALSPLISIGINSLTKKQSNPKNIAIPVILGLAATTITVLDRPFTSTTLLGILLMLTATTLGTIAATLNSYYGLGHPTMPRIALLSLIGTIMLAPTMFITLPSTPTTEYPQILFTATIIAVFPGIITKKFNPLCFKYSARSDSATNWHSINNSSSSISGCFPQPADHIKHNSRNPSSDILHTSFNPHHLKT